MSGTSEALAGNCGKGFLLLGDAACGCYLIVRAMTVCCETAPAVAVNVTLEVPAGVTGAGVVLVWVVL